MKNDIFLKLLSISIINFRKFTSTLTSRWPESTQRLESDTSSTLVKKRYFIDAYQKAIFLRRLSLSDISSTLIQKIGGMFKKSGILIKGKVTKLLRKKGDNRKIITFEKFLSKKGNNRKYLWKNTIKKVLKNILKMHQKRLRNSLKSQKPLLAGTILANLFPCYQFFCYK